MDDSYFLVNLGLLLCLSWYLLDGLSFIQYRPDRTEKKGGRERKRESIKDRDNSTERQTSAWQWQWESDQKETTVVLKFTAVALQSALIATFLHRRMGYAIFSKIPSAPAEFRYLSPVLHSTHTTELSPSLLVSLQARNRNAVHIFPLCSHYWFHVWTVFTATSSYFLQIILCFSFGPLWLLVTWWAALHCNTQGKFNHLILIFKTFHQLTLRISWASSGVLLKHRGCLFSVPWCLSEFKQHRCSQLITACSVFEFLILKTKWMLWLESVDQSHPVDDCAVDMVSNAHCSSSVAFF